MALWSAALSLVVIVASVLLFGISIKKDLAGYADAQRSRAEIARLNAAAAESERQTAALRAETSVLQERTADAELKQTELLVKANTAEERMQEFRLKAAELEQRNISLAQAFYEQQKTAEQIETAVADRTELIKMVGRELKAFNGIRVRVESAENPEAKDLAQLLAFELKVAGWTVDDDIGSSASAATGVMVFTHSASSTTTVEAANALAEALRSRRMLIPQVRPFPGRLNEDRVTVWIGEKPGLRIHPHKLLEPSR